MPNVHIVRVGHGAANPGARAVQEHRDYVPVEEAVDLLRRWIGPFFDTLVLGTPATTIAKSTNTLFTAGQGGSGGDPIFNTTTGSKSYAATNLETSGGILPGGQEFKSNSFGVAIFPSLTSTGGAQTATTVFSQLGNDAVGVCAAYYIMAGAGKTLIPFGSVQMWPAGYGIAGFAGGTTTANGNTTYGGVATNGTPIAGSRNYFSANPITFTGRISFKTQINTDTAVNQLLTIVWCLQVAWWGVGEEMLT